MLNKVKHLLQLQDTLIITPRPCDAFQVVMITKNNTKKVVKLSNNRHFISGGLHPERIKNTVHSVTDLLIFRGKVVINEDFLMDDLLHISRTDGIMFQKSISVKNDALIHTILRNPAVQDAAVYKNDISCHCSETFFV